MKSPTTTSETEPTGTNRGEADPTRIGTSEGVNAHNGDPVVLVDDPAPVRWARSWRRAGRAEGNEQEWHPVRAVAVVAVLVGFSMWQPGAITFVAILTVLVFVHELGHYLVARRVGMAPTDFFVGFGPTVWARTTTGGLRYGVKLLPAGGFVKIPGMGPAKRWRHRGNHSPTGPHRERTGSR